MPAAPLARVLEIAGPYAATAYPGLPLLQVESASRKREPGSDHLAVEFFRAGAAERQGPGVAVASVRGAGDLLTCNETNELMRCRLPAAPALAAAGASLLRLDRVDAVEAYLDTGNVQGVAVDRAGKAGQCFLRIAVRERRSESAIALGDKDRDNQQPGKRDPRSQHGAARNRAERFSHEPVVPLRGTAEPHHLATAGHRGSRE